MVYISRIRRGADTWEVQASERGVTDITCGSSFVQGRENTYSRRGALELREYLEGGRKDFSVPLDLNGTPFQRSVWEALRQIPYGETLCYSQVALRIGRPSAVRAVARAIGKNPCLILVPCHRVLGKDGSLTGFSAGLDLKKRLLDLEGIPYK